MNKQFDNTNRGALFKNEEKKGDSHPDYKGSINVNGVEMWLSAWLKEAKSGRRYMSLSVKAKEAPKQAQPAPKPAEEDFNDDLPAW